MNRQCFIAGLHVRGTAAFFFIKNCASDNYPCWHADNVARLFSLRQSSLRTRHAFFLMSIIFSFVLLKPYVTPPAHKQRVSPRRSCFSKTFMSQGVKWLIHRTCIPTTLLMQIQLQIFFPISVSKHWLITQGTSILWRKIWLQGQNKEHMLWCQKIRKWSKRQNQTKAHANSKEHLEKTRTAKLKQLTINCKI